MYLNSDLKAVKSNGINVGSRATVEPILVKTHKKIKFHHKSIIACSKLCVKRRCTTIFVEQQAYYKNNVGVDFAVEGNESLTGKVSQLPPSVTSTDDVFDI
jgi:hypothetical protein